MSFIKITNDIDSEGVNRIYLEKLGISTKRNDSSTIGQFGSGSKFAPIAALRNGWRWINVGEDENGPYTMEYVVKEEGGFDCISFLYDGEYYKDSSFTLDAGVLSWDESFQIFREAFANALDEKISNDANYSISVVDEVKYEPGKFSVYITADPELLEIVNDFDKYFSLNRENLLRPIANMKVMDSHDNVPNIYYKGVLVSHGMTFDNYIPLWDYEFDNLTLNEERRLRYSWDIDHNVVRAINVMSIGNYELCRKLVDNMNRPRFETVGLRPHYIESYSWSDNNGIKEAFYDKFGEKAVPYLPEMHTLTTHLKIKNFIPVLVESNFMYELFRQCGVLTAMEALGEIAEFDFCELKPRMNQRLTKAMNIIRDYDPRIDSHVGEMKFFSPKENQDSILGIARENHIYLSIQAFRDMKTLIGTIIHELDHIVSGLPDTDSGFRSVADDRIADLLLERSQG